MRHTSTFVALAASLLLAACAGTGNTNRTYAGNSGYNSGYNNAQYADTGRIDNIQYIQGDGSTTGTGAVVGGVLGAFVGNQVGSGRGRTAATIAGAAGGAVAGNQVEANRNAASQASIGVRLDGGGYRTIVQSDASGLRIGDRVRIVDNHVVRD